MRSEEAAKYPEYCQEQNVQISSPQSSFPGRICQENTEEDSGIWVHGRHLQPIRLTPVLRQFSLWHESQGEVLSTIARKLSEPLAVEMGVWGMDKRTEIVYSDNSNANEWGRMKFSHIQFLHFAFHADCISIHPHPNLFSFHVS
ncbi:hypothetical protein XELAEV_18046819mg [Xenopus laevis]|uniref:Uncharacterized protein n=1 Tax=Xenopus laevis TaxID=8355 RepID=A0A974H100_XENLA|nr:hypothetical protein XELAEV_18046819mg [Xenopus laevis]